MNTNQTKTNMTNKSSKLIAILMLICIMISSLCMGCQKEVDGIAVKDSTARKILLAIRENNFSEANSLYNGGRISDRTADALSEALPEMLDDFITEYNAGEKDYNTCIKFCDLLSEWTSMDFDSSKYKGVRISSDLIYEARDTLKRLEKSKKTYNKGIERYNDGKWLEAIMNFDSVDKEDANYTDAVTKYIECFEKINASIEQLITKGDFEQAQDLANEMIRYFQQHALYASSDGIPSDYNYQTYKDKFDEIVAAKEAQAVIDEAMDKYNEGKYMDAFSIMNNYTKEHGSNDAIENTLNELTEEYITMVVQKSSVAIEAKEYLRALEMIKTAMAIVSDERLNAKLDDLNALKPTYLCELSCAEYDNYRQAKYGETYTDVLGNTYDYRYGNLFILEDGWGGSANASYCLNYNYEKFTCTLTIGDSSGNFDKEFQILGDGIVLYSVKITRKFSPTVIELDVSNVNWLEFKVDGGESWYTRFSVIIDGAQLTK